MRRLIRHRDWVLAPLLLVCPLFFVGGPDWLAAPVISALWNQGHWLFFAGLLFWFQGRWPLGHPRYWLLATLAVLVVSAAIEGIQALVGREPSGRDVWLNLLGTWLGLFWGMPASGRIWGLRLTAVALVLWQCQSAAQTAWGQWYQWRQFPVLGDFESRWDRRFWRGEVRRVRAPVREGRYSLAVNLEVADHRYHTGVELTYLPGDWRGYDTLTLSVYNPRLDILSLTLRINDTAHDLGEQAYNDRYNGRLYAGPGWNTFSIALDEIAAAPATRRLDLSDIRRLLLFASGLEQPRHLYLDNLRLEQRE